MTRYRLAEPGVDPLADPLPLERRRFSLLWISGVLLVVVIAVGLLTRTQRASGAPSAPTQAKSTATRQVNMPTVTPTPSQQPTQISATQTARVVTVIHEYQVYVNKEITKVVEREREVTRVVELRWPVPVTQIVVITATPGPSQTPWVVTATPIPTMTRTPTVTPTTTQTGAASNP